ncbi:MAG: DUF2892 domain-containing protein [Thermoanaerobaculia bacterium]
MSNKESRNLGKAERWASVLGGAALAAIALRRRSKGTLGLAALGAPLIWRGATGHCSVYQRLGIDRNPEHLNTAESAASSTGDLYDQERVKPLSEVTGTEGRPVVTTDRQPIGQSF